MDPGLIPLYDPTGRGNVGHALETVALLELERRGCDVGYVRTTDVYEVDVHVRDPEGHILLIQVCSDVGDAGTWERENRALSSAASAYPHAQPLLLTLDPQPPRVPLPRPLVWQAAGAWLLGDPIRGGGRKAGRR